MRLPTLLAFLTLVTVAQAQTPNFTGDGDTSTTQPAAPAKPASAPASTAAAPLSAPAPTLTPAQAANRRALGEAEQMMKNKDYDGAMGKLNQVIQSDPRNLEAYLMRGQLYSNLKQPDKEANDFQSAHLIDPTNPVASFDVGESKFGQKHYDDARAIFITLTTSADPLISDLSSFKVFLCDMVGNHPDQAQKEFDDFNKVGRKASYYFANATWSIAHKNFDDARGWLASASHIYAPFKTQLYMRTMHDVGYLPLPAPAPAPQ